MLGAVQGPAELLPVSSSGHVALLPHLLRWRYPALPPTSARPSRSPSAADHVAVGIAQAIALVPGVSRSGAALPVTAGAGVLKGARILRRGVPRELRAPLAASACAALATGLAAVPLARGTRWRGLAVYRIALGAVALRRQR